MAHLPSQSVWLAGSHLAVVPGLLGSFFVTRHEKTTIILQLLTYCSELVVTLSKSFYQGSQDPWCELFDYFPSDHDIPPLSDKAGGYFDLTQSNSSGISIGCQVGDC